MEHSKSVLSSSLQKRLERQLMKSAKLARRTQSLVPVAFAEVQVYVDDAHRDVISLRTPVYRARGGGFFSVLEDMYANFHDWLVSTHELLSTVDLSAKQEKIIRMVETAFMQDGKFGFNFMALLPLVNGLETSVPVVIEVLDFEREDELISDDELAEIRALHSQMYEGTLSILNTEMLSHPSALPILTAAQTAMTNSSSNGAATASTTASPPTFNVENL